MRACSIVSTPSATISMSSDLPISTIDWTRRLCASERTIGLQPARPQLRQADDRGVAGAEIVDLDIDAERLDLIDRLREGVVVLVEIDRFHELERQCSRLNVELAQGRQEALVAQPPQRDID